ncbi:MULTISPECIES: NYN domain-containing protein [Pasteurella]|uniref:NYN domain n=2 Tax=Pasteurella TaxID=745 RepID=A0A379EWH7_9PAST|nr:MULTISPECIES: NYN domain-containing protein [Pasteurella]VEI58772.1 NYN domain [Pasteurella multocida]EEX49404.1 hypothetical protein HMPREF0621_2040 [Pasteurella dagmatis ATCC 43325]UAX41830.1 NYN domain-containing protein [Pasteurella canis]SNV81824.1 NYN domain [Pasteurella dagmatis]SUC10758.1 NYN domain [Pasteurella canis]
MSKIKTSFNVIEESTKRLAVLIDADNASARDIKAILEEVTKYGEATVKRIYGNFVSTNGQWKETINQYAIKPMQQFAFTTGKNATDGFMIIDAMDLLYTNRFDGFCIVSSDSDFTALAIRLKEHGATVYGFGKKQTPLAFRNACSRFIYVENLHDDEPSQVNDEVNQMSNVSKPEETATAISSVKPIPIETLKKIFEQQSDWIQLGLLGQQWGLLETDFDPRNYGCKKLSDLVKKHDDIFECSMRNVSESGQAQMYVKLKK